MKNTKTITAILGALIVSFCTLSLNVAAQKSFSETLDIHLNAIKSSDLARLDPTVADSITHISPTGERNTTKEKFMKVHEDWFKRRNWQWHGTILKKHSDNKVGYALIDYTYVETTAAGTPSFKIRSYLVLIFKRTAKGWQLVHDQNTMVPIE